MNYYSQALELTKEIGDKRAEAINHANIGSALTKLNNFKDAEKHLLLGLSIADSIHILNEAMQTEIYLSELSSRTI